MNLVSSPIETKARENQTLRRFVITGFAEVAVEAGRMNENKSDVPIKPRTNFGKRLQMTAAPVLSRPREDLALHHTERMNAATPISTFWEKLTMVPIFVAVSPINSPAATTEPVVSSVPPSHAPATISGMPNCLMSQG